jgi:signal transduction histidine kinase
MPPDTAWTGQPAGRLRRLTSSIRFRITAIATVAVVLVLLATAVALVIAQRRLLTENLDESLSRRADDLAAAVAAGQLPNTPVVPTDDDTLFQVVGPDGMVLAASRNMEGEPALAEPSSDSVETIRTVGGLPADDGAFRLLTRRLDTADGPVVVHVAGAMDDIDEAVGILGVSLAIAIPAVAALLAALVWWLVGRTLRPVEAIRTEVTRIGGTELHRRVPQPDGDDEIARLAGTMNAMLDRVEHAAARQQRFVADASHELRSPLTRIRSELEVDLAHPDRADPLATHRSVLIETVGLQRLVENLLHLARSDAGALTGRREAVDLDDGRVTVDTSGLSAAQVIGDRDQLTRAIRNLTDNAARHAATTVQLALSENGEQAVLAVTDDGPGIPHDQRERVFERFTRLDEARAASSGGTGLGLSITRDIVERHGGTVTIDVDHHPGTRFVVTLPRS